MSRTTDSRPLHVRYRDELKLLLVMLGTVVPAVFVADMLVRAIEDGPLAESLGALVEVVGLDGKVLGFAFIGFLFAVLVLLFFDYQKRAQAILLALAAIAGSVIILTEFDIWRRLEPTFAVGLIGGFVIGLLLIGGQRLRYIQVSDTSGAIGARSVEGRGQEPLTFPLAETALYYTLILALVLGFFEAHTDYAPLLELRDGTLTVLWTDLGLFPEFTTVGMTPELITFDLAGSAALYGTLYWFVGYESRRTVFVLGPSGSGKTHLSIGLYLQAQEMGFRPRNTTEELDRLVQRIIDEQDFIPERTREAQDLSFEFTAGKYFPKNVQMDAFDYPGEYLPHVPAGIDLLRDEMSQYEYEDLVREQIDEGVAIDQSKGLETGESSGTGSGPEPATDGGTESAPTATLDVGADVVRERVKLMRDEVCPRVATADLLVLVVDMERFVSGTPLGTEWYSNLLGKLSDEQEAIIVATKADLISTNPVDLRNEVDRSIRDHMGTGRLPIPEKPYPVFYETYEAEDGERKMRMRGQEPRMQDSDARQRVRKRPILYGFDDLLYRFGR